MNAGQTATTGNHARAVFRCRVDHALVNLFDKDGPSPGLGTALGTAIAIALGFAGCHHFFFREFGVLSLVPMAVVAGLVFWLACDMPIKKAFAAGGVLLAYKICLSVLAWLAFG
jgi:hypothetical protein